MNNFRLLQMILYEVIVFHLFLMRKVTFLVHMCISFTHMHISLYTNVGTGGRNSDPWDKVASESTKLTY